MSINVKPEHKRYDPSKAEYPFRPSRKLPADDGEFIAAYRSMGAKHTAEYYGVTRSTVATRAKAIEGRSAIRHVTIELDRSGKTGRALARIYSGGEAITMTDVTEPELLRRIARLSEQGKLGGAQ